MQYQTIHIQAYWFEEGEFWNVDAIGFNPDDQPVELETGTDTLSYEFDENEVAEQLELIGELYLHERRACNRYNHRTDSVVLLLNGTEIKTICKVTPA